MEEGDWGGGSYYIVAGELCKLAQVMALSPPTPSLQSDAACQRLASAMQCGIKDSACLVSVPCAEKCWSAQASSPSLHAEKCVTLPLVRGPCAEKCWSTPPLKSTC